MQFQKWHRFWAENHMRDSDTHNCCKMKQLKVTQISLSVERRAVKDRAEKIKNSTVWFQ